jgi:hypothetical protein
MICKVNVTRASLGEQRKVIVAAALWGFYDEFKPAFLGWGEV